jgi:hypothetical protein
MPLSSTPPDADPASIAAAGLFGILGRFYTLAHSNPRKRGWEAAWELAVGIPLGLMGAGVAEYLSIPPDSQMGIAVIVITSIGGGKFIDATFVFVIERWKSKLDQGGPK